MSANKHSGPSVALLGGTFDPVHNGHLRLALDVLNLGFDEVRLIPNAVPPHRPQPQATVEHRLAMLQRSVEAEPGLVVDDVEIRSPEVTSYSYQTLMQLKKLFPNIAWTWVLGSDAAAGLDKWHRWEEFVRSINVLVISRPGYCMPRSGPLHEWQQQAEVASIEDLLASTSGACYSLDLRDLAISSTEIRQMVAEGRSPRYLIPEGVLSYIGEHQLYRP